MSPLMQSAGISTSAPPAAPPACCLQFSPQHCSPRTLQDVLSLFLIFRPILSAYFFKQWPSSHLPRFYMWQHLLKAFSDPHCHPVGTPLSSHLQCLTSSLSLLGSLSRSVLTCLGLTTSPSLNHCHTEALPPYCTSSFPCLSFSPVPHGSQGLHSFQSGWLEIL